MTGQGYCEYMSIQQLTNDINRLSGMQAMQFTDANMAEIARLEKLRDQHQ